MPRPPHRVAGPLASLVLVKETVFPQVGAEQEPAGPGLTRYAWLAIAAAVATISLKAGAYLVTDSVGLLSDAAESLVNLVTAIVALIALKVAVRPPDAGHHFGHGKAEYFSAGLEGLMIFIAATAILISAAQRFLHPVPLERVGAGLAIATLATAVNGAVGLLLVRTGRRRRSATLVADGKHLLTDVWTSVGVIAGVILVAVTGLERLDPVVAALVGVNILVTGYRLVSQSIRSLLDASLPPQDLATVAAVLDRYRSGEVDFATPLTRESGRYRFVSLRMQVPGEWSVQRGHGLAEEVAAAIRDALPDTTVHTQLEPAERRRVT